MKRLLSRRPDFYVANILYFGVEIFIFNVSYRQTGQSKETATESLLKIRFKRLS